MCIYRYNIEAYIYYIYIYVQHMYMHAIYMLIYTQAVCMYINNISTIHICVLQ